MKIKKLLFTAIATIVFIAGANAQNVTIPDANFKAALVANASINNNMDAEIQVSEAAAYTGAIHVSQLGITDLTGIAAFVLLDSLDCSFNYVYIGDPMGEGILFLGNLNLSANIALTYLKCSDNALTSLNVSANTALTSLDCSGNDITSLNVSSCTALNSLDCSSNQIAGLDISSNLALTYLDCSYNLGVDAYQNEYFIYYYYMDSLDVSANIALTILKCNNNGLLSINTTGLTGLTYLDCSNNGRLNYISSPGEAPGYYVISTPIFDFESNLALAYLNCSSNGLSSLDVSENAALTYLDCSNYSLSNGEGDFIGGGTLSSLDFSSNVALVYLNCSNNFSSSLNVSGNVALTSLYCIHNSLSSLDVSSNLALTYLNCYSNQLTSLDVSTCSTLAFLYCFDNNLTSLNVNNGYNINMFDFQGMDGNNYPAFLAYNNPNLSCIEVDNVAWSNANWANNIDATASFSENCSAVGILDNDESTAILAYPNPTTGTIYLSNSANITLTDLSGKLLLEQKNTKQLDLSSLPAGMYFLNVGENNKHTFKVIKE